jgi:hypothetical protein
VFFTYDLAMSFNCLGFVLHLHFYDRPRCLLLVLPSVEETNVQKRQKLEWVREVLRKSFISIGYGGMVDA